MERFGKKAPAKARMYERSRNVWRMRDKKRNLLGSIIAIRSLDDFPFYVHSLAAAANANVIRLFVEYIRSKAAKASFRMLGDNSIYLCISIECHCRELQTEIMRCLVG